MKLFKLVCFGFLLALVGAGCGTLDKGGVYHGDKALYATDATLRTTVEGIDSFLKWEVANHEALKVSNPEVPKFANQLRDSVPTWFESAKAMRSAYIANPTPENAANVQNIVNLLNAALAQAAVYLSKPIK
jgi:hypothetical protein